MILFQKSGSFFTVLFVVISVYSAYYAGCKFSKCEYNHTSFITLCMVYAIFSLIGAFVLAIITILHP